MCFGKILIFQKISMVDLFEHVLTYSTIFRHIFTYWALRALMGPGQDPYGALRARARTLIDPLGPIWGPMDPGQDPYEPGPKPLWALWARARTLMGP